MKHLKTLLILLVLTATTAVAQTKKNNLNTCANSYNLSSITFQLIISVSTYEI